MAKNAQFYLLNPEKKITVEQLACDLAAQAWRLGKRVLIACETQEQAVTGHEKRRRHHGTGQRRVCLQNKRHEYIFRHQGQTDVCYQ